MTDSMIEEATGRGDVISIPKRFKNYEVMNVVETGATCVVFAVQDIASHERFAAKVMPRPDVHSESLRFLERELRLCVTMSCPYLVNCLDILYLERVIIVIMEFCEGGDLLSAMRQDMEPVMDNWPKIFAQLCLGVQYLHNRGLAHRDLKLENVLIDEKFDAKLCDYGALCEIPISGVSTTICGTLSYKSPEQIKEEGYDAQKADIWSLGVILYTIVTGRLPWKSESLTGMKMEICEGLKDVDVLLNIERGIIDRCCELDPGKRARIDELLEMVMVQLPLETACMLRRRTVPLNVKKSPSPVAGVIVRPVLRQAVPTIGARRFVIARTKSPARSPFQYLRT